MKYSKFIKTNNVKKAVVFLHGYGADKDDLISLASVMNGAINNTAFFSLDAPFVCGEGFGKEWFPRYDLDNIKDALKLENQDEDIQNVFKVCDQSNAYINNFIVEMKNEFDLKNKDIFLIGFSQGAMMALYNSIRQSKTYAGVIAFSGLLLDYFNVSNVLKSKPPVLLVHGKRDLVVDVEFSIAAEAKLKENDFDVEILLEKNLEHGINENGLIKAIDFLISK